jgi:cytochrome bd ubiquinol oxidase subunit II
MPTLWFILVGLMLAAYVLLDGFDLGAGALHLFAAKNDQERRTIIRAIRPVWDGNEVWLIAAGGTLFFTFPLLYASSFSGFYLPLIIVLWLLMLRGAAIELRSHLNNAVWSAFWDGTFAFSSVLLAFFFGAALANVVRGVPLDASRFFFEPLWTTFNPTSATPGILDWYTVLIGLLALAALTVHGATWVALKTEGPVQARSRRVARNGWLATIVLTVLGTVATYALRPTMFSNFHNAPLGLFFPALVVAGLIGVGWCTRRGRDEAAFFSSGAFLLGLLASAAFGLYPDVLPAVNPAYSLTVGNASAGHYGLVVGLIWWVIGMLLAATYFILTYRLFRGKVRMSSGGGY